MASIALNSSFERGKSDVSVCPKVLNEQFGLRDIGVTVFSVTCATERALNGGGLFDQIDTEWCPSEGMSEFTSNFEHSDVDIFAVH